MLTHLGEAHHAADDPDAARAAWQRALDILIDLDNPAADDVRSRLARLDQAGRGGQRQGGRCALTARPHGT